MGTRALRIAAASLFLGVVTAMSPADAQPDPFVAMNALRVTPPVPAPDVTFRALDGRQARLATLRGGAVLLTFFTTW
jgi:cytochrome oxidase Cu insertion factor (SCO1/SenC/PrrC family)